MLLAKLTSQWPHAPGERHQVIAIVVTSGRVAARVSETGRPTGLTRVAEVSCRGEAKRHGGSPVVPPSD